MSILEFQSKNQPQQEQPQTTGLQYGDLLCSARRDLNRARSMFSFLSRAASEIMRNKAELSEEEIRGFDWCVFTSDVELEKSDSLLEIAQNALGGDK